MVSGIRNSLLADRPRPRRGRDPDRDGEGWPAIYPTRTARSTAHPLGRTGRPVYDRKVQAISYDAYGATPALVEVDDPVCPQDGVVVEVRATGVCRSDWHAWQGHDPVALPQIPGHEFAGVVAAVGSAVGSCAVGDRVTVPFVCGCGRCEWCLAGEAQVCPQQEQPGFTMPGSFAQLVAIPAADFNVVQLPDEIDFVAAAALGCRFATAYRAITVHGRVGPATGSLSTDAGAWGCLR